MTGDDGTGTEVDGARWVGLCAAAEAVGITAAAGAARASQALVGEPGTAREAAMALSLVVAGGLVEGVALGLAQAIGLRSLLPAAGRRRWVLVTVAVAGLGWAAGSAPAVLAGGGDGGGAPAWLPVIAGAAGIGVVMGAALGAAQATVLRRHVRHPWRWIGANAAAWTPAMALIFIGAGLPGAGWPVLAVLVTGTLTGLTAGAVLGLVTGRFLPALGAPARRRRDSPAIV